MIVDTSALVALLRGEEDAKRFARALALPGVAKRLSAASYVELGIVVDRTGDPLISRRMDELIREAALIIEPVTAEHAVIAREAYRAFGKGSGHPAQLNFGDCLAYALAKARSEPLLFKGSDFACTDIEVQA